MRERRVSDREVFKKEADKGRERTCPQTEIDGDGFERVEVVERVEIRMRTRTKEFVYGNEVGEEDVSATTDELWLMDGWKEVEERVEMAEVAEIEFRCRVGLRRSMASKVSWYAMSIRLKVWRYSISKRM